MSEFAQTLKQFVLRSLMAVAFAVFVGSGIYLLFAYYFTYSSGESVGFVQKLSYKGWVCKTWEGEQLRALSNMPTVPEKFIFTVRDNAVVYQINAHIGQKVVLEYEQHRGLPSCFGETEHFVVGVKAAPEQ